MIDEYYISIYKWNTYLYIYNTAIIYIVKKCDCRCTNQRNNLGGYLQFFETKNLPGSGGKSLPAKKLGPQFMSA
jgi:hypothetical protein